MDQKQDCPNKRPHLISFITLRDFQLVRKKNDCSNWKKKKQEDLLPSREKETHTKLKTRTLRALLMCYT